MTVVFTRTGTPAPGKQVEALEFAKRRAAAINAAYSLNAEICVRFGGPLGQVIMVSRCKNMQQLEDIKRKVITDTIAGKIPVAPEGVFSSIEDAFWLTEEAA